MIQSAILLCSIHFFMVRAIMKPPINKKIVLFIYMGAVALPFKIPSKGYRIKGRRAVADKGIASVIHQIAIRTATAAMRVTIGFSGSKSINIIKINRIGPKNRPIF
jgi:hypothetical protein